jgi:hypothetical protein
MLLASCNCLKKYYFKKKLLNKLRNYNHFTKINYLLMSIMT